MFSDFCCFNVTLEPFLKANDSSITKKVRPPGGQEMRGKDGRGEGGILERPAGALHGNVGDADAAIDAG